MVNTPNEPMLVLLTRIEGTLNLVSDRVNGVINRVDQHERDIGNLKSTTQTLTEGARSSKDTAEALALALKEAKDTAEAAARKEAAQVEATSKEADRTAALGWTPVTKVFAVAAALSSLLSGYMLVRG